jgi:hypothetical protein
LAGAPAFFPSFFGAPAFGVAAFFTTFFSSFVGAVAFLTGATVVVGAGAAFLAAGFLLGFSSKEASLDVSSYNIFQFRWKGRIGGNENDVHCPWMPCDCFALRQSQPICRC